MERERISLEEMRFRFEFFLRDDWVTFEDYCDEMSEYYEISEADEPEGL